MRRFHRRRKLARGRKLSKRQKKEVKAIIGHRIETKWYPGAGSQAVTSAGLFTRLSGMSQGPAQADRIGDDVQLKQLLFRWEAGPATDEYNRIRVVIFRWKEDDQYRVPTAADLFDATAGSTYEMLWPISYENRDRIHVCYDKVVSLHQMYSFTSTGVLTGNAAEKFEVNPKPVRLFGKRLGAKKISYNLNTTTGYGHIYLCLISDSGWPGHPNVQWVSQLQYTDA